MSLFGSLFSGVSGLNAQSRAMGMISDNIANVNTTAYKGALAQFENLVTRSRGSYSYSPGGVRAQSFYTVATQGLIQSSASPTDVAISGAGFFVVNAPPDGQGEQLYTRAGSFSPDFQGDLRTTSGNYLQGWALDADEAIVDVNTLQTVNVRSINGLAAATTTVAARRQPRCRRRGLCRRLRRRRSHRLEQLGRRRRCPADLHPGRPGL